MPAERAPRLAPPPARPLVLTARLGASPVCAPARILRGPEVERQPVLPLGVHTGMAEGGT